MIGRLTRPAALGVGLGALTAWLTLAVAPAQPERNQLWMLVSLKCMRHLAKSEAPIPCDSVDVSKGWDRGVAYLKDGVGVARELAIPTHPVSGVEDPVLRSEDEPNYFAAAWSARNLFSMRLKTVPSSHEVAVVVDSKEGREQDQLHLVVDCLDRQVSATLEAQGPSVADRWDRMTAPLNGRTYWARKVEAPDPSDVRPFRLLADLPGGADDAASWSLAMAQPASLNGRGYLILADRSDGRGGGRPRDLLDPSCAVLAMSAP